jgi:predicted nucleotidyltransferase component of viral defense system
LKVEINTREHGWVGTPIRIDYNVANPWFTEGAEVVTVALPDLLATKLRALYQRRKGRDLFDLHAALDRFPDLDFPGLLRGFHRVMEREGRSLSWREFEANVTSKLQHALFAADVPPLLVSGEFNPEKAWEMLADRLQKAWNSG